MGIIINPGTGPVSGASQELAAAAVEQFVSDLELQGVEVSFVKECRAQRYNQASESFVDDGPDGRYEFLLSYQGRECEIEMPGIAIERVRYLGEEEQDIWDFPRLYVDGSSWVWKYGLSVARSGLLGEDDEDE